MSVMCRTVVSTLTCAVTFLSCKPSSHHNVKDPETYIDERLNSDDQLPQAPITTQAKSAETEFTLDCRMQAFSIVGGSWVSTHHSLAEALVKVSSNSSGSCTATVIGIRHILTAAHCLKNIADPLSIRIGTGITGEVDSRIRIKAFRIHPQYQGLDNLEMNDSSPAGLYDVALLLAEDNLPESLRPVGFAQSKDLMPGKEAYVAGFGAYGEGDYLPRPLTAARTRLAALAPERSEIQIESSSESGPCYGDSGGPLFIVNSAQTESCFLLAGSITGRGRGSEGACRFGRATVMDLTLMRDWVQCSLTNWNAEQLGLGSNFAGSECL